MKLTEQVKLGLSSYGHALEMIFSKGLWGFFFFPLGLNIIFLMAGFSFASSLVKPAQDWMMETTGLSSSDFFLSEFIRGFVLVVIVILVKVLFFFLLIMIGGYLTLILLSPVLAIVSERAEKILTGKDYPFNPEQFMRDLARGLVITFRNMFLQTGATIMLFFAGFIPVVGLAAPFALFAISGYFYGFSFLDYSLERKRFSIGRATRFMQEHKGLAFTIGSAYSFVLMVPYIGIFLAGFGAIVAVVAASISTEKISP